MNTEPKRISFPVLAGWPGCALTAAIIAVRAFQPGAQPMCEWSWWSWALMSIPALFPLYVWISAGILWLACSAAIWILDLPYRRKR